MAGVDAMSAALASMGSAADASALASMGLYEALLPSWVGAGGTVVLLLCFAIALGLGMVARPGRTARLTAENALVAGVLAGLGALGGWFVGGVLLGLVAFSVGVALVIAALRFPTEEPRDLRRVASGRLAVAALGVSALVMFAGVQGYQRGMAYLFAASAGSGGSRILPIPTS